MCAVIKRGILGGFSNKIGNVVGTSWKGIAVVKSLPLSVANPNTAGQIAQRSKFKTMSKIGSAVLASIAKPLWDRFAQQESGFNAFLRANIDRVDNQSIIDPAGFEIARGKMTAVTPSSAAINTTTNNITVSWPTAVPDSFSLATDIAFIMVNTQGTDEVKGFNTGIVRSAGTAVVNVPFVSDLDPTNVWLAFRRADGTIVSNTGYFQAEP